MRNRLPILLALPAMILAAPACLAQARDGTSHEPTAAPAQEQPAREHAPRRSAFGRVMGVMIDALRQDALHQGAQHRAAPGAGSAMASTAGVRTTEIGTPLGIEVGEAFRPDAQPRASKSGGAGAGDSTPLAVQGVHVD